MALLRKEVLDLENGYRHGERPRYKYEAEENGSLCSA